jgi:hypothetical protein
LSFDSPLGRSCLVSSSDQNEFWARSNSNNIDGKDPLDCLLGGSQNKLAGHTDKTSNIMWSTDLTIVNELLIDKIQEIRDDDKEQMTQLASDRRIVQRGLISPIRST